MDLLLKILTVEVPTYEVPVSWTFLAFAGIVALVVYTFLISGICVYLGKIKSHEQELEDLR